MTPITSPQIAPAHGFFTRRGGVSGGLYDSLNCGPGSDDLPAHVTQNRARVTAHLGATDLRTVHQVHSADVVVVTPRSWSDRPRADAMVTTHPRIALGALAADCAPVLFADAAGTVVGAAHAGWKGALGGVLEATLTAMTRLGATDIRATVGPCISQRAYEVGPEYMDRFLDDDPDNDRFFAGGAGDRVHFDLPGYALSRLRAAGATAEWTGHCTFSDPARFFSYRRATHAGDPDYGRQISAIRL